VAIHAIADSIRTADWIWGDPTVDERGRVEMAVAEYIAYRDFPAEPDGCYFWGCDVIWLPAVSNVEKYFGDVVRGCRDNDRPDFGKRHCHFVAGSEVDVATLRLREEG